MIELDSKTLRQLQMIELEMLIEVNRICKKCGIHYTIIAGTMLGAVRHGGFIPWDDDADIGMLRSEYEKFRIACENELDSSRFFFFRITGIQRGIAGDMANCGAKVRCLPGSFRSICHMSRECLLISFRWTEFLTIICIGVFTIFTVFVLERFYGLRWEKKLIRDGGCVYG